MSGEPFLFVRASSLLCAIPIAHAAETMRARPLTPLRGAPAFVLGVATLRGAPTPVLDLAELVTGAREPLVSRLVRLRRGARPVALAVGEVVGVRALDLGTAHDLPPLLAQSAGGALETIGALDRELFVALRVSRLVPPEVWAALDGAPS